MKRILIIAALLIANYTYAQKSVPTVKPKLVVGIVVDQMKYDYVFRYWEKLGNGGFKRLMNEGMFCKDVHYNYVPTYTGPGHAAIYTGTTPATNGIISNDWYNRETAKTLYCVEDKKVATVGAKDSLGQMSPRNLLTTTVGDELRISNTFKNKVIGIALKDRGAILPAGHSANAAYWWDGLTGDWITSTFYMAALPQWVIDFNAKKYPVTYLKAGWNTLRPIKDYTESTEDNTVYEGLFRGEKAPVFPHNLADSNSIDAIKYTPWGNTLTRQLAEAAIEGEKLGQSETTDMLTVSFSSPDYVGHRYGTQAIETEDIYLQLDKDLETFLNFLDKKIGKLNVLLFLTADHAAIPNPKFLADHKIPAGYFNSKPMIDSLKKTLLQFYGDTNLFLAFDNDQIYLNRPLAESKKINVKQMQNEVADFCTKFEGVHNAISASRFNETEYTTGVNHLVQMGYNRKRSGDVIIELEPGLIEWYGKTGTTHGSPYTYDTHVPLWFYGGLISNGTTSENIEITDIAATLSNLLNIETPNGSIGKPIQAVCK
jgi:predicted AlkP superfamily pyrophosphatase or phosphodiesterase